MTQYTYSAGNSEHDHDVCSRHSFPAKQCFYGRMWDLVATDLADHFFHNHDGWDHSWPVQFRLYEDDKEVGRFSVEQEAVPSFSAYVIYPEEASA